MLNEERTELGGDSAEDLRKEYETELAEIIEAVGVDEVTAETGVDRSTIDGLLAGEGPTIDLEAAAAIFALDADSPDAESIYVEATEHLLMGMSIAVLDVDTIAADVDLDLGPRGIQQKLERRSPMTLKEFAILEAYITEQRGV